MSKKLDSMQKKVNKINDKIKLNEKDNILFLTGEVENYEEKIDIGFALAKTKKYEHIVNNIVVKNLKEEEISYPKVNDLSLENKHVDVLIIGGGVIGSAILRELSKYKLKSLLIEKEEDIGMHASSRNDGNVHVGIDLHKKSKKLYYLQKSVPYFKDLCNNLNVDYKRTGQGIVLNDKKFIPLVKLYLRFKAFQNKVPSVIFYNNKEEIHKIEPNLKDDIVFGAIFQSEGQVNPYQFSLALAESGIENGGEISLETYAKEMEIKNHKIISVTTNRGKIYPKVVINAAGVFSEEIAKIADDQFFSIHPRKGVDAIMDKKVFPLLSRSAISIYRLGSAGSGSKSKSKGGGVVPTTDDNTLIGPDAIETPYKEDFSVSKESLEKIIKKQQAEYKYLSFGDIITYFAGTRACTYEEDFIVEKGKWTKNIVHAAGIQSPGLTCAPAIAEDIVEITKKLLGNNVSVNEKFKKEHKGIIKTRLLNDEERDELIKKNPNYGKIICRCEEISKGEIIDALHSIIPPKTIDGIKRRVRSGMGRCQGGFCEPHVLKIMSEEMKIPYEEICKKGDGKIINHDIKGEANGK